MEPGDVRLEDRPSAGAHDQGVVEAAVGHDALDPRDVAPVMGTEQVADLMRQDEDVALR